VSLRPTIAHGRRERAPAGLEARQAGRSRRRGDLGFGDVPVPGCRGWQRRGASDFFRGAAARKIFTFSVFRGVCCDDSA
jgi:hypothetical protein